MERFVCVHGHYYQPPRENPWLEYVEVQDSAYPYHDWNERVTADCYAPNTFARVLDGEGRILRLVNNYSQTSYNFGPTLLTWLADHRPADYAAVIEADRLSQEKFGGHGSAMAQVYNHMIMPLANHRDRVTQIAWGIRDFESRFGRRPEGMWLAETAADLETLDILAEQGIKFTVLAPHQARRVKPPKGNWRDVSGGRIDPTMPYAHRLPSGRKINLFFYDGPISRSVAFDGLLANGETFARRLLSGFDESRGHPQMVHIATDGETYGHHHVHGDMALAYALSWLEEQEGVRLTNYSEFLESHPPTLEAEIFERTSWSCTHGVDRWCRDCGCNSTLKPGWRQGWREPLRDALDHLRDEIGPLFEQHAGQLLRDPWAARDAYINIILDRSPEAVTSFFDEHAVQPLDPEEQVTALRLLEMQRQAMLMYTSCGWFFDDISGPETVQVIMYAGRVLQLSQEVFEQDLETDFLKRLESAKSNLPEHLDGHVIFEKWVRPVEIDLEKVAAHYAISSLLDRYPATSSIYCYQVEREDERRLKAEQAQIVLGAARVTSTITQESEWLDYGVIHFGGYNVSAGVCRLTDDAPFAELATGLTEAAADADVSRVVRLLDQHFGQMRFSARTLFRDQQRHFLSSVLDTALVDDQALYRQVYDRRAPLLSMLASLNSPIPEAMRAAGEVILNTDLKRELSTGVPDQDLVRSLLARASEWNITLDAAGLEFTMRGTMERGMSGVLEHPGDSQSLDRMLWLVALARDLPFDVDFWLVQNIYDRLVRDSAVRTLREREDDGDQHASEWLQKLVELGDQLGFQVGALPMTQGRSTIASLFEELLRDRRVPRATYRLQLKTGFGFSDAQAIVPYLDELGISDIYTSPVFTPRKGSEHGYDICEHSVSPDLGGEEGLRALSESLSERNMSIVLDVVPNHMGIGDVRNHWWVDVLENGPNSPYAAHFDIDWHPVKPELQNKVLLPILEGQYGEVLEAGKLKAVYSEGAFFITYYDTQLPVTPPSYAQILEFPHSELEKRLGETHPDIFEYESIQTAIGYLPPTNESDPARVAELQREKEVIKRRIAALYAVSEPVRAAINSTVETFNGRAGDYASFDHLDSLLSQQVYRMAYWRVAGEEINYRRFFDINDLAAIRTEDPVVFDSTHDTVFRLLSQGTIKGLRIDHIDGLADPASYLWRLQEGYLFHCVRDRLAQSREVMPDDISLHTRVTERLARWREEAFNGGTDAKLGWPLYVVAEKIVAKDERLPDDWSVAGTTGYDFLAALNELMVDRRNEKAVDEIYRSFTGDRRLFSQIVNSTKKITMLVSMASEIHTLSHHLERLKEKNRHYRDFTLDSLTFALREVIAALPVYRTYITGPESVSERDIRFVEQAVNEAKRRNPRTASALFDFLKEIMLLQNLDSFHPEDREEVLSWVRKLQQITGPVMAKGVEDTAFYVFNRLISLNEVGGFPEQFGSTDEEFHHRNADRATNWPGTMLATSTHDTKRGEDVRARINVLSELPDEWQQNLKLWSDWNNKLTGGTTSESMPDRNDEYLFYEVLLGAWPAELLNVTNASRSDGVAKDGRSPLASKQKQAGADSGTESPVASSVAASSGAQTHEPGPAVDRPNDDNPDRSLNMDRSQYYDAPAIAGHAELMGGTARKQPQPDLPSAGEEVTASAEQRGWAATTHGVLAGNQTWSAYIERLSTYMLKSIREAKVHTSWVNPNERYESATAQFVADSLRPDPENYFLGDVLRFVQKVAYFGQWNSLSQALLKLTSPGVPDIYQGCELWDLNLVDPDNRREVDFDRRREMLRGLRERLNGASGSQAVVPLGEPNPLELALDGQAEAGPGPQPDGENAGPVAGPSAADGSGVQMKPVALMTAAQPTIDTAGWLKLYIVHRVLALRREKAGVFARGSYEPVTLVGDKARHLCAFERALADDRLLVLAPRLTAGLTEGAVIPPVGPAVWGNTRLRLIGQKPGTRYRDWLSGAVIETEESDDGASILAADVLKQFPVALLERLPD